MKPEMNRGQRVRIYPVSDCCHADDWFREQSQRKRKRASAQTLWMFWNVKNSVQFAKRSLSNSFLLILPYKFFIPFFISANYEWERLPLRWRNYISSRPSCSQRSKGHKRTLSFRYDLWHTLHIFFLYMKPRIWAGTESYLKLSDFWVLRVSYEFLKDFIRILKWKWIEIFYFCYRTNRYRGFHFS